MSFTPLAFNPKQITSCEVSGLLVDGDTGELTVDDSSTVDLHLEKIYRGFALNPSRNPARVQATDAGIGNQMNTFDTFNASVSELVGAGMRSALYNIFVNYDYVRVAIQAANPYGGSVGGSHVIDALIQDCPYSASDVDQVITMTMVECGVVPIYVEA